jgi:S1-C subfamily serine protease
VSIRVSLPDSRTRVGSGFVATSDGWIVTSSHVVSPVTGSVSIGYADGQLATVEEVYTWAARDLAVIVPRRPPRVEPLRLADSTQLAEGDVVFACGVPFGLGRSLARGVVDGRSVLHSSRYLVFDGILAEGLSYPGDSGGPVVAEDGRVVGVHLGSVARERRAVVPSNLVRRSLMEARVHAEVQRRRLELARVTW